MKVFFVVKNVFWENLITSDFFTFEVLFGLDCVSTKCILVRVLYESNAF